MNSDKNEKEEQKDNDKTPDKTKEEKGLGLPKPSEPSLMNFDFGKKKDAENKKNNKED